MTSPKSYNLKACPSGRRAKTYSSGQAIIASVIFLVLLSVVVLGGLIMPAVREIKLARGLEYSKISFHGAEAGIEDAIYRLRNNLITAPTNYTLMVGSDAVTVDVASAGNTRTITASGNHQNRYRKLQTRLDTSSGGGSFFYGIQVGDGGLRLENNSKVVGNVYSDGNIICDNGTCTVTGDAIVAGGIDAVPSLEYAADNTDFLFASTSASRDIAQSFTAPASDKLNRVGVKINKVGAPADLTLHLTADDSVNGRPGKNNSDILASASIPASLVGSSVGWVNVSFVSPPTLVSGTKYWIVLDYGSNSATNYWSWRRDTTDDYTNNTGKYTSDCCSGNPTWTNVGGDLSFRVWVGGTTNKIDGATIGDASSGTAWANMFTTATKVHGSNCPNQYCVVDTPAHVELPITDSLIQDWRDQALAGGANDGDYSVTSSANLGPKKIVGNLSVDLGKDETLTINGTVWVTGNITFGCDPTSMIKLNSAYGTGSGSIIADGKITVNNNCNFAGSGDPASYILLLSAKNDLANTVIDVSNNSNGVIYYANTGRINFGNNSAAREATGYGITLNENAVITYETGLANVNFSSGPGGSFQITKWRETQ